MPINLLSGSLNDLYTEYAGYGDIDYHFTTAFDVMAGVRYGTNRQNYSQPESGALVGPAATIQATSRHPAPLCRRSAGSATSAPQQCI